MMHNQSLAALGWRLSVDRGPDWLFVRIHPPATDFDKPTPLAHEVWGLLEQHLVNRVVLEMDDVHLLTPHLMQQLVDLQKRIQEMGGILRLSGLAEQNQKALRLAQLEDRFPRYVRRDDAVRGFPPPNPR